MIPMVTDLMRARGLTGTEDIQNVDGIDIYAPDYFNPLDDATGRLRKTENTRTIHWFMKSWLPDENKFSVWLKRLARRFLGMKFTTSIKHMLKR